jgi:3-oxoacyl-[acyl-carrier protein] reductase
VDHKRLEGRTALITGADKGIGREIARLFAEEGAEVCINDLRIQDGAESLTEQCRDYGVRAIAVQADVSKVEEVQKLVQAALDEFHHIDILVNNAGIITQSRLENMSVEMWDEMIAVDLRSVFLCTRFVLPSMIERRFGRIINVASQLGQKGGVELTHYSAAKAGVIGLTKALAREVGEYGITANCIAPGPIDTALMADLSEEWKAEKRRELPIPRFGKVEEVAPTAVMLAAEPDGNIYTGQTLGPNSGDVML